MGWETGEEGGWPAIGVEVDFPLMEGGRKGQRVGASLGSSGMSHQGTGEWRVDRIWRLVIPERTVGWQHSKNRKQPMWQQEGSGLDTRKT